MRTPHPLSAVVVAAATALIIMFAFAPPANAKKSRYVVGIGDQHAEMFWQPAFAELGLKRVRYIVPWDAAYDAAQVAEMEPYMWSAQVFKKEVLVTFTARRGCFLDGKYSKASRCKAPSAAEFRAAFRAFRARYPSVKHYSPWNEANHVSQPTYKKPHLAVRYYEEVRKYCKGCTIVALDVLDSSAMAKYAKAFLRKAKGKPRIFGLHNYSDVNRRRSRGTRAFLKTVPGQVWLTETGGVVAFGDDFPYDEARAAARTRFMFNLADQLSVRKKGMRSRITRLYPYKWTGVQQGSRFDAGFTNPDGTPRPALEVFKEKLKQRLK